MKIRFRIVRRQRQVLETISRPRRTVPSCVSFVRNSIVTRNKPWRARLQRRKKESGRTRTNWSINGGRQATSHFKSGKKSLRRRRVGRWTQKLTREGAVCDRGGI